MQAILIGSTGTASGRSLMSWFLAQRLTEEGCQVGFLKPSASSYVPGAPLKKDHDIELMKAVLGNGVVEEGLFEGADATLIMGSESMFSDFSLSPTSDTQIAKAYHAQICLMDRYESLAESTYSILSICSLFKGSVKIVVVNRVPEEHLETVRTRLVPRLLGHGIPRVAVLPEDPVLASFSVTRICEVLEAEVLHGQEHLERLVGGFTLGSQALQGPLQIFRHVYGKIVLLALGQDQRDPSNQTASEDAKLSVVGILLTSGRMPAPVIIDAARQAGISLLLTSVDTFGAFERIQAGPSPVTIDDRYKQKRFSELLHPFILGLGPLSELFNLR